MKNNLLGISSGIINMLLFGFAPVIVGLSSLSFFEKLLYSQVFSLVTLFTLICFFGLGQFVEFSRKFRFSHCFRLFIVGLLRLAMSLCFFYALSNGPRIENNIITLTWPIFLVVFNVITGEQKITKVELLSLILAFVGSSFIVLKQESISGFAISHFTYKYSLLYAFLGGLYYFVYKRIKNDIFPSNENEIDNHTVLSHLMMVFWQSFVGVILVFIISPLFEFSYNIPTTELYKMIALGVVGYALPQIFISHSNLNLKPSEFAVLRYLNPVICTVYLYIFLNDPLYPNTILGTTLVFTCVYMIQIIRDGILNAQVASIYFGILYASYLYFTTGKSENQHELETFGAIFSIVLAFTLSRIHQKQNEERSLLNDLNVCLFRVYKSFSGNSVMQTYLSNLIQKVLEFDFYYKSKKIEGLTLEISRRLGFILKEVESKGYENERLSNLDIQVNKWLALKIDKVSIGEKVSIWTLGIISVFVLSSTRNGTFESDVILLFVSTTIVYLCWLVRDYDLNLPNRSFSQVVLSQSSVRRIFGVFYIPYKAYINKNYPAVKIDSTIVTTYVEWVKFESVYLDLFTFYKSRNLDWEKKKNSLLLEANTLMTFYKANKILPKDVGILKDIIALISEVESSIDIRLKEVYRLYMNLSAPVREVQIERKSMFVTWLEVILFLIGLIAVLYVLSLKDYH